MFARHDLAWLGEAGWRQVLAGAAPEHALALERWREADWPLVVRRADADQAPGQVALGLALPPRPGDGRKVRVSCRVDVDKVVRHEAPLSLAQAARQMHAQSDGLRPAQPHAEPTTQLNMQLNTQRNTQSRSHLDKQLPGWSNALAVLALDAATQGINLRVYGSLALQLLTGQTYLTAASDIDVLVQPYDRAGLDAALALLHTHAAGLPLDGEIVFPAEQAVAWKEWAAAQAGAPGIRVLVKAMNGVALARMDTLLATLEEATCTT